MSPARSTSGFENLHGAVADIRALLRSAPCDEGDPAVAEMLGPDWSPTAVYDARRVTAAEAPGPPEPVPAPVPGDNQPIRDADAVPEVVFRACGSSASLRPMLPAASARWTPVIVVSTPSVAARLRSGR